MSILSTPYMSILSTPYCEIHKKFQRFTQAHPEWKETFNVYKKDSNRFQRIQIVCEELIYSTESLKKPLEWNDFTDEERLNLDGKDLMYTNSHEYHPVIDVETGDIYFHDRKREIFLKHILVPISLIIFSLVPIALIISSLVFSIRALMKNNSIDKECIKNIMNSIKFFAMVPILLSFFALGLFFSLFDPNLIYYSRYLIGKLQEKIQGIHSFEFRPLIKCFFPCINLMITDIDNSFVEKSEFLEETEESIERTKENLQVFALKNIKYIKSKQKLCVQIFHLAHPYKIDECFHTFDNNYFCAI